MTGFKHLLVPTDFSEAASRALDVAMTLGTKFGSGLTLLHAYALPAAGYGEGLFWPLDDLRRAAQETLDVVLSDARRRYPRTDGMLVEGDAWRQILVTAEAQGIDLIVMGTHGRRWLSRTLLGSSAERVVRASAVPVLTVSAGERR
ncbi:MAG TPA: universal stress protein [Polyangiaceae bacterium]|nr:universal stress protein [Polyangiaceae bacterium]